MTLPAQPRPPIDLYAPTISLLSAVPGKPINRNLTVQGRIRDDVSGVNWLQVQVDSNPIRFATWDGGGNFTFATSLPLNGTSDGRHRVRFRAADRVGHVSAWTTVFFTLDTTRPLAPTFDLDPTSDTLPLGDRQTTRGRVTLRGQAEPGSVVLLKGTGRQVTANRFGRFAFANVALKLGENTFTVQATDAAGNKNTFVGKVTRVPIVPPTVTAGLQADTGSSATDGLTSDPTVAGTVAGTAPITLFKGGLDGTAPANFTNLLGDLQADGSFVLSRARLEQIAGGPLAEGAHLLHLQVANEGTPTPQTLDLAFTLDTQVTTAPSFDLDLVSDTPPVGDRQTTLATATLTGQTEANATVVLQPTGQSTIADGTGMFSFTNVALALGENAFTAQATDLAGNVRTFAGTITRVEEQGGENPPAMTAGLQHDTGASAQDRVTSDPAISGRVTDTRPVTLFRAGFGSTPEGEFRDVLGLLQPDGRFVLDRATLEQIAGGPLADGDHVLHLKAGNDATPTLTSLDVAFTLDTQAPGQAAAELSTTSQAAGSPPGTTTAGVVPLVGTAEPDSILTLVGPVATMTATVSHAGTFRLPGVSLEQGENTFVFSVSDRAGNTGPDQQLTLHRVQGNGQQDPVLFWNQAALEAVRLDASSPPYASRALAMVHAAVLDAVNAIEGTPARYVAFVAPAGASAVAAVAGAAHQVLLYLYPGQKAALDQALAASLAGLTPGTPVDDGLQLGRSVGDAILAMRADDGAYDFVTHTAAQGPGVWEPTPPMYAEPLSPQWATLQPFVMTSPDQFRPDGPPALTSQEWADAYNEVKALGSATGSTRTAAQTQIARFWADGLGTYTPPGHWNKIAGAVAGQEGTSLSESARLFADLNLALADAAILVWNVKYADNFWRPVTAIRKGDTDGNDQTAPDAAWSSLLVTPNFPEYVSGHSTFSGAAEAVLTGYFGEDYAFTTDSVGLPGVTRSFASFHAAAEEAAVSRLYGGIHYRFSNEDGLATGRALGRYVLDTFSVAADRTAPTVNLLTEVPNGATAGNIDVVGRVLDPLSGVRTLEVQRDEEDFVAVSFATDGSFSVPTGLPTDGSADGAHTLRFRATDFAGTVSAVAEFRFVLDTRDPTLTINAPSNNGTLTSGARLTGSLSGTGSAVTAFAYRFDGGPTFPVAPADAFDVPLELSRMGPGAHTLTVTATDAAGHTTTQVLAVTLPSAVPLTVTEVTPANGADDVGVTFRPKVTFSRPIDVATLNATNFYATDTSGTKLPATITSATDGTFAWLFFAGAMPGSSTITLVVDGSTIRAADGSLLDAAGTGTPGSLLRTRFTTVSTAPIPNTSITGILADPGPDLKPMTFDDLRAGADGVLMTADDVYLNPIAGAKVYVLGLEGQFVFTDAQGRFTLPSVPSGNVKLVIDGRTATNAPAGTYYPEMVMDLEIEPGRANTVMGSMGPRETQAAMDAFQGVYLPRLRTDILQTVNPTDITTIGVSAEASPNLTPEQRAQLSIQVQPGSLIGENGQPLAAGQVGISTVPPELVRDMLPPGLLQHTFDITIQAPGVAVFSTPLAMTFPNVFNAAPGTKLNFLSFDHTTGRLVIDGTATVSADGQSVTTDPGNGITHPGWHGPTPAGSNTSGGPAHRAGWKSGNRGGPLPPTPGSPPGPPLPPPPPGSDSNNNGIPDSEEMPGDPNDPNDPRHKPLQIFQPFYGLSGDVTEIDLTPLAFNSITLAQAPQHGELLVNDNGGAYSTGPIVNYVPVLLRQQLLDGFMHFTAQTQWNRQVEITSVMYLSLGYSTTGRYQVGLGSGSLEVFREQVRLRYLGFPGRNGQPVPIDGNSSDTDTRWAIDLFDSAVRGLPEKQSGTSLDVAWANAINAPGWREFLPGAGYEINPNVGGGAQTERWGTSWAFEILQVAGAAYAASTSGQTLKFQGASIQSGGDTKFHDGHETGIEIDIDVPGTFEFPGPYFFCADLDTDTVLAGDDDHQLIWKIGTTYTFDKWPLHSQPQAGWSVVNASQLIRNKSMLTAAYRSPLLLTNPNYKRSEVEKMIDAFRGVRGPSGASVGTIFWNDPYFYADLGWTQHVPKHDGHFHVNVIPPGTPVTPFGGGAFGTFSASSTGFGSDPRLYYRIDPDGGTPITGRTNSAGVFSVFLPANTDFTATFYQASTNSSDVVHGRTNDSGQPTNLRTLILGQIGGADSDGDGIPDLGELAIGTSPTRFSTVEDGIGDGDKLALGLDPLDGRAFPTGVISSLPFQGQAKEVVAEGSILDPQGQTAYVATGSFGLAIVEASQFQRPLVLGQLDLPGDATDVAVDPALRIAAVAANAGGLHVVDVTDPMRPALLRTINVTASQVEIVNGIAYATVGTAIQAYDLLTGELRESLAFGGPALIALAREGTMLYTLDSSNRLRAIEIGGFQMLARGTLTLPAGGGKLFVGNGVAYVGAGGGFVTANVADPNNLLLLSGVDAANIEGTAVVANGSGLAVAVGSVIGPTAPINALDVLNVADPTNTGGFLTRINLPSAPNGVALAAGIAFIANGTSGLQVVNYQPFDNGGIPPTVSISTTALDVDPAAPGIQVVEGTTLPIRAAISDDVQVRNVELFVNGQVVRNDVSFPFDFSVIAPAILPGVNTVTIQVRATDTGGNPTLSDPLTLDLVPDTIAPVIVSTDPADGSIAGQSQRTVRIRFSEALDAATVSNATFRLLDSQGNQVLPLDVGLRNNDELVQLTFDTLPPGNYQLVVDGANVTDRGGNALGSTDVVSRFTIAVFTAFWINPAGGDWDNPGNWSTGVVPGATDDVLIDVPDGSIVITHSGGNHAVRSLAVNETLVLSGGALSIAGASTVTGTFTLSGGSLTGVGALTVSGTLNWTSGGMGDAGRTRVTGQMAISGSGSKALGGGRVLDNAGVATWSGRHIDADGGTFNNLAGATLSLLGDGGVLSRVQFPTAPVVFTNAGTLRKSAGTGTTSLWFGVSFANSGTVEVSTGTLQLGSGTSSGAFTAAEGATLQFPDSHTFTAASSVTGAGTVRLSGGSINVAGSYDVGGDTFITGPATVTSPRFAVGGMLTVTVGVWSAANFAGAVTAGSMTLQGDGGTANFAGDVTVGNLLTVAGGGSNLTDNNFYANFNGATTVGSLVLTRATGQPSGVGNLGGTGTVTVSGQLTWLAGGMGGTGRTIANGGMAISGSLPKSLGGGRIVDNAGPASWSGRHIDADGGTFNNLAGATLSLLGDGDVMRRVQFPTGSAVFTNAGTLRKAAGSGTTSLGFEVSFTNTGTVEVATGTLSLGGGTSSGAFTATEGATLQLTSQTLTATSSITGPGNLTLAGGTFNITSASVAVGGTWTVGGNAVVSVGSAVTAGNLALLSGTVTFDGPVTVAAALTLQPENASSFTAAFNNAVTAGSLSLLQNTTFNTSWRLGGTGTVTVTGQTTWTGGNMEGAGRTVAGGGLVISGAGVKRFGGGRTLENGGVGTWTGTGNIEMSSGAVFTNLAGATFDVQTDRSFAHTGGDRPTVNNAGTFRKSAGTGTAVVNVPFNSSGSVIVQSGTLQFSSGTSSGAFTVGTDATLQLHNGHDLTSTSSVTGAGNVELTNSATVAGAFDIGGDLTLAGGTFNFAGAPQVGDTLTVDGTANFAGSLTSGTLRTRSAGVVNLSADSTVGSLLLGPDGDDRARVTTSEAMTVTDALTMTAGELGGSGTVTVNGLLTWTRGRMVDAGRTLVTGQLAISGSAIKALGARTLENGGVGTWTGTGNIEMSSAAVFTNLAGATFDVQTDRSFVHTGGPSPTVNNAGTFRKSAGTGTASIEAAFNNSGSVEAQTGTLSFGGYTQTGGSTLLNGGTIGASSINIQAGLLSGSGTINANVTNGGQVNPGGAGAGVLTISGNYTQTAAGALNVEVGGLEAGTQFDRLNVTGTANLNGTLNLTLISGFDPAIGNTFQVITYASRSGGFTTVNGTDLGEGKVFLLNYNPTNLTLVTAGALRASGPATGRPPAERLAYDQLAPLAAHAVSLWVAAGGDAAALHAVSFRVAALPGGFLGVATPSVVWIDDDASGHGWFVDGTPDDNAEFEVVLSEYEHRATPGSPAFGAMDLLTVLAHELGHALGLEHTYADDHPHDVMGAFLPAGSRRLPDADEDPPGDGHAQSIGFASRKPHASVQGLLAARGPQPAMSSPPFGSDYHRQAWHVGLPLKEWSEGWPAEPLLGANCSVETRGTRSHSAGHTERQFLNRRGEGIGSIHGERGFLDNQGEPPALLDGHGNDEFSDQCLRDWVFVSLVEELLETWGG